MGFLAGGVIVFLIILLVIIIIIAVIVSAIVKKVNQASRSIKSVTNSVNDVVRTAKTISQVTTGTPDIAEGIRRTTFEHSTAPKNVSDMASILLPKIAADFPEYHNDEMAERARNVLTSYLFAIDESNPSHLTEGNEELKNKLTMQVKINQDKGYVEHFERIKVHKCVLNQYEKTDGKCTVTYQAAVQYMHYITEGDKIKTGRNDLMTQSKYDIKVVYVQDRDMVDKFSDMALSSVCPHCGAPIKGLGDKKCPYCGSDVEVINIYAWSFADVSEHK
ncbi:MAG: zinc ribbon domain-containing protein [Lachnospiraceae bacterium]|nr:zinc ribbon domain-containing protein [Lachnospiraceae bacterium]